MRHANQMNPTTRYVASLRRTCANGVAAVCLALLSSWGATSAHAEEDAARRQEKQRAEMREKMQRALDSKKADMERCAKEIVFSKGGTRASVTINVTSDGAGKLQGPPQIEVSSDGDNTRLKTCAEMRIGTVSLPSFGFTGTVQGGATFSFQPDPAALKKQQENEAKEKAAREKEQSSVAPFSRRAPATALGEDAASPLPGGARADVGLPVEPTVNP